VFAVGRSSFTSSATSLTSALDRRKVVVESPGEIRNTELLVSTRPGYNLSVLPADAAVGVTVEILPPDVFTALQLW
jgi:hypothetical protein